MSDFLGKLKTGIEKLAMPQDTVVVHNDTIPKSSMFWKENIDFQNADTLVREKTSEEFIEADIIRQFLQKNIKDVKNPELSHIKQKLLQETGREFSEEELGGFLELDEKQTENAKILIKKDEHKILTGDDISYIASNIKEENLSKLDRIMKMNDSLFIFNGEDIVKLSTLSDSEIERVKKLSEISERQSGFSAVELILLAQLPESELKKYSDKNPEYAVEALTGTAIAIEAYNDGDKTVWNVYDTGTKGIVEKRTEEYSENVRTETIDNTQNKIKQILKTDVNTEEILEEKVYRYDSSGAILSAEVLKNSQGMLEQNVSRTDKNGKQTPIQWASKDEDTGNLVIQKNFESYDGTKTEYYYEETPDGVKISDYKITDKNGKVLLDEHSTFAPSKNSDNKFISTKNGRVYEITHTPEKILISDSSSGEYAEIELDSIAPDRAENIMQVLKETSGDYLMQMAKNPIKMENSEFDPGLWGNSTKILQLGVSSWFSGQDEQFSVYMHELGHFIDTEKNSSKFGIISQNPELKEIYRQELENFKKNSTVRQQEFVDYFISGNPKNAKAETMAESTMILSTPYSSRRSLYLQQHFPRTIAKIAELTKDVLESDLKR